MIHSQLAIPASIVCRHNLFVYNVSHLWHVSYILLSPLAHKYTGKGDVAHIQGHPRHLLTIVAADLYNSIGFDAADLFQLSKFGPDYGLDQVGDFWEPLANCWELLKGKTEDLSFKKNLQEDYSEA